MKEFTFVVCTATSTLRPNGGLPVIIRARNAVLALRKLATLINMETVVSIEIVHN